MAMTDVRRLNLIEHAGLLGTTHRTDEPALV
jgi:hypothetical protein